ncbi:unnamed protein product [Protopolystoma xenopodis]|uniref:Uncharacterized protein n=1 Tax=Protopolystoma xenopodis TaxID=117903 RepID=A0A3S5BQ28_9PLAT|nr:unnamed protein product [Protopolystoma xenopodis]
MIRLHGDCKTEGRLWHTEVPAIVQPILDRERHAACSDGLKNGILNAGRHKNFKREADYDAEGRDNEEEGREEKKGRRVEGTGEEWKQVTVKEAILEGRTDTGFVRPSLSTSGRAEVRSASISVHCADR